MGELTREQLEKMVDVLTDGLLAYADAQIAEIFLRKHDIGDKELKALGFDVEV